MMMGKINNIKSNKLLELEGFLRNILEPSRGEIGNRLNKANERLRETKISVKEVNKAEVGIR